MDSEYRIDWADGQEHGHQIICESRADDLIEESNDIEEDEEYLVGEEIIPSTEIITISNSLDQIAAENLIYMAQDVSVANMGDLIEEQVDQVDNADYNNEQQYFECHVTEEVITDDWVQQQGEDRVEVPVYQLVGNEQNEEVLVPLPTDEYTTSRPYPCDFCSRRFRKKANLMNHMVAHKNVKPHICNLCGAKYIRKMELMNHLKVHAQVPDSNIEYMDHTDGRDTDEQDADDESLLTVLHTNEGAGVAKRRKVNAAAMTAGGVRKVVKNVDANKKVSTTSRKQRYDDSANTSNDYLGDHIIDNDPARPFVCQVCGVSFSREKALNAHVSLHGVDNAIECVTCNEVFWSAESLQEHQKIHADEESSGGSEYEPDADDKTASDDDDDFDPEYGNYYCSVCGMAFHRRELLKRHAKTHKNDYDSNQVDSSNQNHCCNVCGSTFEEALDLLAHAEIHTRSASQKCTLCGESFDHDDEIRRHITMVHEKELTNTSCRMCGKLCKDERTLMKHAWDHSKEKNHSCPKCGKSFFNKARLKRHMQSHRNKSVACNVCGENFPDGRSLMNHRHSHTNLSGRQFPCRECGKTFGSRSSQQIHMRIHTGERPYGCRFCWKAFADGGTLRKHERIHTGEKPYACPVCPRAFNQRVVLREHIRSHHSQPDPNYEDSLMPFYCTVCGNLFKTSQEIIQHLIEHSDANTVSNRQPVVGPRKYKRRRKLKPEELESFRKSKNETSGTGRSASKRSARKRGTSEQSDLYYSSSCEQQETEISYETARNDTEMENIEVDEPIIQKVRHAYVKQETNDMPDPLYTGDYLDASPKRKSPTKKPSTIQNVGTPQTASSPSSSQSTPIQQRQPRLIHTSKKKVLVETKGGRMATKMKTIVTTNEIRQPAPAPQMPPAEVADNGAKRRSNRTKQATSKVLESMPSPTRNTLTNGMPRSSRSPAAATATSSTNAKFQNNLLAELSKKSTNYSPDVVSDLEEILGSPIKTAHDNRSAQSTQSRKQPKAVPPSPKKANSMLRTDYNKMSTDDEAKPATRSSKRLSGRAQPVVEPKTKVTRNSTGGSGTSARGSAKKSTSSTSSSIYQSAMLSEESQGSQDESYNSLHMESNAEEANIVMNIKQEKEVSFTLTDDSAVFTCEMCSAQFSDRAQLLVHVPVHI